MAATYYYLVADLRTNSIYGEVPMEGASFDRILNGVGNFQGATHMDNRMLDNDALISYTEPGKTALYIYRETQIVWGGIIWARWYQSQGKSLQFSAQTFESYAYRRVRRPLVPQTYNQKQTEIIDDMWDKMQTLNPYSDIGIGNPGWTSPGSDVVRKIVLNPWDLKTYGETFDEITGYDNGCDYTIQVIETSGQPDKYLDLWYPRLGGVVGTTNLGLDYPGNIKNYYFTENAAEGNTKYFASGDGDGKGKIIGTAEDTTRMSVDGYPRLDKVIDAAGVTLLSTANRKAASALMNGPVPQEKWQVDLDGSSIPQLGTYSIGDDFSVAIDNLDPRFANGKVTTIRAVGWSVNPTSSSNTEEVSLVLDEQVAV